MQREHHWDRAGERGAGLFPELPSGTLARATAEHVERYLKLARQRRKGPRPGADVPEDLYLVDETETELREIVGLRLRGHPLAMLGAVRFPRHVDAPVPHGRPSIAFFFSEPPVREVPGEGMLPPGIVEVFLPHVDETIPEMVERLRADPAAPGVRIDVDVVDFAFDLRFMNPSAVPGHGAVPEAPKRRLFRTIYGHVLSGISVGFFQSLGKGLRFVTVADAMQHRPGSSNALPTLALNRRALAVETLAQPLAEAADAARTLSFHPSTANPQHILGWAFDAVHKVK